MLLRLMKLYQVRFFMTMNWIFMSQRLKLMNMHIAMTFVFWTLLSKRKRGCALSQEIFCPLFLAVNIVNRFVNIDMLELHALPKIRSNI